MKLSRLLVTGGLAAAALFGLAFYFTATSGSKQAEFGSALVSTAAIGMLVALFERTIARQATGLAKRADQIGDIVSLAAAPEPAVDQSTTGAPPREDTESHRDALMIPTVTTHRFQVQFDGWQRDTRRVDARTARIRVYRDGKYFQFFTAIVSAVGLATALRQFSATTELQILRSIVDTAVAEIRKLVLTQEVPLDDPTKAVELFPDIAVAASHAAGLPDRNYEVDNIILTFDR